MSEKTYAIDRIADLLAVPADRRADCLRQIEYALSLHELACGDQPDLIRFGSIEWTDDGEGHVSIHDAANREVLALIVTKGE